MKELIYYIPSEKHGFTELKNILENHREIKFVSLMGIDLGGNATDEKIPIGELTNNTENFLTHGVQTDGSSVVLHGIATLNNARVDMIPDMESTWFVDYNYDNICEETGLPVGTLRIPSFLIHNNRRVDSRSILMGAVENFKNKILAMLKSDPVLCRNIGINDSDAIESVNITAATELEFWVRTPDDRADIEKLATSQQLKEQYWKRTQGTVRTALERTITSMEKYGLKPEMGHKEVGGIRSKIDSRGETNHVMEQLEIDWKYSTALQTADNELMVKEIVRDVFREYGLDVTFAAKPIEGVAGSGEHTHLGVAVRLKDGSIKNLFAPLDMKKDFLSPLGYGAIMGILKNYEVINPFVAPTNDAFNRLKPGFEAPVCIVCSLGKSVEIPSRNRSVLAGLIRDMDNPLATRFEVRSPNPHSNTYLVISTLLQGMLDGIAACVESGKISTELEREISKEVGEESFYLETNRAYRSEMDVFEHFSGDERNKRFGIPPATVWENISNLKKYEDKRGVLLKNGVFTEDIIESFRLAALTKWVTELQNRIIPNNIETVKECKKLHLVESCSDLDVVMWEKINAIRHYLMKDSMERKSLFTKIREALLDTQYETASNLQLEMNTKINEIKDLYTIYKRNLFEALD